MEVNHTIVLEYLKLVVSWPFITLVIVLVVMNKYGDTIKGLFPRLRSVKALGTEAAFDPAALAESVVEETLHQKREEIQELPESIEKEKKISALATEAQALKLRLTQAIASQLAGGVPLLQQSESPVGFRKMLLMNALTNNCSNEIAQWVVEHGIQNRSTDYISLTQQMLNELEDKCRRKAPEIFSHHNHDDMQRALSKILFDKIPPSNLALVAKTDTQASMPYTSNS
jgi:hypothetical protein